MRRERSTVVKRFVLLVALASFLFAVGIPALARCIAGGVALRHCTPEGYGLTAQYGPTGHDRPTVRITVGWLTAKEKRRACLLRGTIGLTIAGSSGVAVSSDWHVNSVRRPWSGIVHSWVWRNWCDTKGSPTVQVSDPDGVTTSRTIADAPACLSPDAPSTVEDLGTGTKHVPRPTVRFPPHMLPKGAPPTVHWAVMNPKNGWLVSDGYTLVAVYAGSPGEHPSRGRFLVIRQNAIFGVQYFPPDDIVNIEKVGAIKITHAPRGRSRETSAQTGRIAFVSTNGTRGVLDLRTDRVRITHRGKG
jgi:hypothetical protein